jgi:hypothetical protein
MYMLYLILTDVLFCRGELEDKLLAAQAKVARVNRKRKQNEEPPMVKNR